jgi:hypothetical protein
LSRGSPPAKVRRFAALLVLLVVASALLVEISSGISETNYLRSSTNVARWNLDMEYYACLTHQVESLVPKGRPVWASGDTPNGPADAITLKKVLAPYAPLELKPGDLVHLFLITAPHDDGCLGMQVRAVWPNGTVRFGAGSLVDTHRLPDETLQ